MSVPTILRRHIGGSKALEVAAGTAASVLHEIDALHPGFANEILTPEGNVKPHINFFLGDNRLTDAEQLQTSAPDGTIITILTAVAGGSSA